MEKRLVYGTSDHLANHAEVMMTETFGQHLDLQPTFFYYPKGEEWAEREKALFDPYSKNKECEMINGCFPAIFMQNHSVDFLSLQEAVNGISALKMTMGEISEKIRKNRERKSFIAFTVCGEKPVHVSSKNKKWKKIAPETIGSVLNDQSVKLGGAFIYFLFGAYLGENYQSVAGIVPNKTHDDVLGAFWAGAETSNGSATIVPCGEFDFMTSKQWEMKAQDGLWRKAPYWAMEALKENPEVVKEVKHRLLSGEYSPLAYDEEDEKFFFMEN
jgi:hypothetical protein